MKEIIEAFMTRIKSPVFGYFILSWIAFNWKPLFYLFFSDTSVGDRLVFFNIATNYYSLAIYPFLIASVIAVFYPWINYVFLLLCKKPVELRNDLQAESENKLLMKKQQLEKARSLWLATREKDLIDRAKRDAEVQTISDKGTKQKLQNQINVLRKEIDQNITERESDNIQISNNELMILKLFTKYPDGLSRSDIQKFSKLKIIENDHYLDELVKKNFLLHTYNDPQLNYDGYKLTPLSRAYLVKNKKL